MDFAKIQKEYLSKIDHTLFSKNHIDSFDYFLKHGINSILNNLEEITLLPENHPNIVRKEIKYKIQSIKPGYPNQTPSESRITHGTYSMPLFATILIKIDGEEFVKNLSFGNIPLMVLSSNCVLSKDKQNLQKYNEDEIEVGGYFIVNGLEKILRNIIVPRKNYPMCVVRGTFQNRRNNFTNFAVNIKSSNNAYRTQSLFLIYTQDQTIYLSIMIKKIEYLFPIALIIKAIVDINDYAFVKLLELENQNFNPINLLKDIHGKGLKNQQDCLKYIGFLMRHVMQLQDQTQLSDQKVGELFLQNYILIHLQNNWEKVQLLNYMIQKLYFLQSGNLQPENLDSLSMQEILSSGQLYGMFFREKLEEVLQMVKYKLIKDLQRASDTSLIDLIEKAFQLNSKIGSKIQTLLSTGNIKSKTGLDLMQSNGFSIIAERLNNMRFWSHLRSIHRGAYFVEMKTTSVRKLLPDCWGFLCPVHTPDGSLCGLLNHLAMGCLIQNDIVQLNQQEQQYLMQVLLENGMINTTLQNSFLQGMQIVLLDGKIIGQISQEESQQFVWQIRKILKNPKKSKLKKFLSLSITHVEKSQNNKQNFLPGIYLSCSEGRPLREVYNIKQHFIEKLDPLEQQYLMIATNPQELNQSHTHIEIDEDLLLSELAAQIPYMVHNQSPRNMYQCQMAKQTMGIPTLALQRRSDNKMYVINYPQKPLVKSQTFDQLGFNHFPSGTNAVIAVLSYTGFDIEDAMIINKQAYERGFMHGRVEKTSVLKFGQDNLKDANLLCKTQDYKNECQQLKDKKIDFNKKQNINDLINQQQKGTLQIDGLPQVESRAKKGDSKICFVQQSQKKFKYFKETENCKVESIFVSKQKEQEDNINVDIKLRISRNPVVGDKFSSRHGQKGVLGILWNQIDMPFSESGITPDIIINPNAFPSRMTIGMLIEILAGKTASLKGDIYQTKAFQRCEFSNIGEELQKFGLNKMGTELLHSGVYGVPLKAEIYQGVVYYQRLRHMIKDKAQARSMGPIDCLTRQPIKGRKKGGGIRLGEMERDALIAHGVSYILKERLLNSSDKNQALICQCGSLLNTYQQYDSLTQKIHFVCKKCQSQKNNNQKYQVTIPYVLRYLVNELAAMNIKLNFLTKQLNQQMNLNINTKENKFGNQEKDNFQQKEFNRFFKTCLLKR